MAVSTEERIKQLIEQERSKRREIEDKKKELEKKKKEVDELEHQRRKEIQDTRKELDEQIEELVLDEKKQFQESEERQRRQAEGSLETLVGGQTPETPQFKGYGDAVQAVLQGNTNFYNLTNYNIMNRLEELAGEARNRPLTEQEKDFVEIVEYHARSLSGDDYYKDKQGSNYLKKELAQIDFINKMAKKSGEYQ
jgi:hypothetical protein